MAETTPLYAYNTPTIKVPRAKRSFRKRENIGNASSRLFEAEKK